MTSVSILSALAHSALALACLIAMMRLQGRYAVARRGLILALAAWSLASLAAGPQSGWTYAATILRDLTLILALYGLFAAEGRAQNVKLVRPVVGALIFVELLRGFIGIAAFDGPLAGSHRLATLETSTLLGLLSATGALVLLHNLYSSATVSERAILAWPVGAFAGFWAFELNARTLAFMTGGSLDGLTAMSGFAGLLVVLAALTMGGQAQTLPRLQPSRTVAFQLIPLALILLYFLAIATLWAMADRRTGDFLQLSQIGFGIVGMALAVMWLPSARSRGWLRVMMAKHLFQHRYDYRHEWLRFTHALAESGKDTPDLDIRALRALSDITESSGATMLRPDESGTLVFAAQWPETIAPVPAALSELKQAIRASEPGRILDLSGTQNWPDAWAGVPLLHADRLLGFVVLLHPATDRALDWEDFDLLKVAGRQIASHLAEQAGQRALEENRKFDEFNRRMAFVMHDIKNLSSQLSLLVGNAERHIDNPDFRADMLVTLRSSSDKLNRLLDRLGRYGARETTERGHVHLADLAMQVAAPFDDVRVVRRHSQPIFVMAEHDGLEQALTHLVANAREASGKGASVTIEIGVDGLRGSLTVADTGCGMSAAFIRNELFKPFVSTKNGGFGIGAHEARTLIRGMGGRLDVDSREGVGTRFTISLPLAQTRNWLDAKEGQQVA